MTTTVVTPSGRKLEVADDQVEFWADRGYNAEAAPEPAKKTATKKAAKKSTTK